uniref:Uncharacterized protein n=1 Tax=Siphoviridae sp. ctkzC12 TaxID=2826446 RepID=A0A8S5LVL7_9CAUD|nr:MAG TPA: hypothetical protein [Siphoviridae sp. ctkzC12]
MRRLLLALQKLNLIQYNNKVHYFHSVLQHTLYCHQFYLILLNSHIYLQNQILNN